MQLKFDEFYAEKVIPVDDSVRLLDQIVENMDLTPLMRAYKRTGRGPATEPATLLKILLEQRGHSNFHFATAPSKIANGQTA